MKISISLMALVLGATACAHQAPVVSTTPISKIPIQGPSAPPPIKITIPVPFWAGGDRVYVFANWEEALRFASDKYVEYLLAGDDEIAEDIKQFIDDVIVPAKEAVASSGDD
jgi:hypothetical protein